MRIRARIVFALALSIGVPHAALAVDADAVNRCHQDIVRAIAGVKRGRIAQVGRCLKSLNYDACVETDEHTAIHENELRRRVAGDSSSCRAAIASGAAVADFGPATCGNEWAGCDAEVPAITTIDDVAECLVCAERGYDFEIRHELGLPRAAPDDADERRCTRRVARLVSTTIRKAVPDAASCADGGAKPFACPVDASTESRFGRALSKFARAFSKCRVDEGRAPGALANLCEGTAIDAAGLTACFEELAKCLACRTANGALGQAEDCAAFSGFARCDGML